MYKKQLVLVLLCFFIFFSCSNEEKDWEKAKLENSIPAYKNFLKRHPQGVSADIARLKIENFYNDRTSALREANTVKIVTKESFPKNVSLPFRKIAKWFFWLYGVKEVRTNAEESDLTLTIRAHGVAPPIKYHSGRRYYSQASCAGEILLEHRGKPLYTKVFHRVSTPPETVYSNMFQSPSDAPFKSVVKGKNSFLANLVEMMGEAFGYKILLSHGFYFSYIGAVEVDISETIADIGEPAINALISNLEDKELKATATIILGKIGDSRAVEPLIAYLKNKNENRSIRNKAARVLGEMQDIRAVEPLIVALKDEGLYYFDVQYALQKITGEDSFHDQEWWKKWWEENKGKYPRKK